MSKQAINEQTSSARSNWRGGAISPASMRSLVGIRGVSIWVGMLLSAGVLFGTLVWMLLFAPKRTPLIVFESAPYSWPLPPSAFSTEDVENFESMDGKTLSLRGDVSPIRLASDFWKRLENEVLKNSSTGSNSPRIVWISMHGIANNKSDDVYLLPPGGSPLNKRTWIDCRELIEKIDAASADIPTVLVLDSCRMQANWNIGLTANQFVRKTKFAIESLGLKHLTVLLPASEGEIAFESPDLNGSVFGHYMQLGIAGAADCEPDSGNRDGWVSTQELYTFVATHVDRWARNNRGVTQRPQVYLGSNASHCQLVRSLDINTLSPLVNDQVKTKRFSQTITDPQLDQLWQKYDSLREKKLYSAEPLAFRDLEHRMLWLESLSGAGDGYHQLAEDTYQELNEQFRAIEQRISQTDANCSYSFTASLISGSPLGFPSAAQAHSLPMARWVGAINGNSALQIREELDELSQQATPARVKKSISVLSSLSPSELAETRFLRMMERYQTPEMWLQSESISNLFELQRTLHELSVPKSPSPDNSARSTADNRIHHWTRALIERIDEQRRNAEDDLLAEKVLGFDRKLAQAHEGLSSLQRTNAVLQKSLEAMDLAATRLGYMAQWITHPLRARSSDQMQDDLDGQFFPLQVNVDRLAERLSLSQTTLDAASLRSQIDQACKEITSQIESPLQSFNDQILNDVGVLLASSDEIGPAEIRVVQAALSLPLFDWKMRRDLRKLLVSGSMQLQNDFRSDKVDAKAPEVVLESKEKLYSDHLNNLTQHPLETLLGLNVATASHDGNAIERFTDSIDDQLGEIRSMESLDNRRATSFLVESRVRFAAPIWFPNPSHNAVRFHQKVNAKSLFVWHGQRAVDDFWGPLGEGESFFDTAASDYLDNAIEIDPLESPSDTDGLTTIEFRELRDRIAAGRKLAANWIRTQPRPAVQLGPGESVTASVMLASGDAVDEFRAPDGTASVVVQGVGKASSVESDTKTPRTSSAIELPILGTEVSLTLPAIHAKSGAELQAQTIFRGHEYDGDLKVTEISGPVVDFRPHRYESCEVSLSGKADLHSVVFILDCSASMSDPLGSNGKKSRLDVAKSALQELLIELANRNNVRVGLRFFGHRVGWSTDGKNKILKSPRLAGEISPGLRPSQDVERVMPLGRFDLTSAQSAISRIDTVESWGQSPLYLSTLDSIKEFGPADIDSDCHVIVMTDGGNYQFIPPDGADVTPTAATEVLSLARQKQVPVSILGLAMKDNGDDRTSAEFADLCRQTGGQFYPLMDSTDLRKTLRDLLDPGVFTCVTPASATNTSHRWVAPYELLHLTVNRITLLSLNLSKSV